VGPAQGRRGQRGTTRQGRILGGLNGNGRGYLPPRPFLFGGSSQLPLGGGFLSPLPALSYHLPGGTGTSGFGPRFRGGFPFCLAPIGPPLVDSACGFNLASAATQGKPLPGSDQLRPLVSEHRVVVRRGFRDVLNDIPMLDELAVHDTEDVH
jgi:hypothetical protein